MKRLSIISLLLWIGMVAFATGKSKVMWLDCSANFQRIQLPGFHPLLCGQMP
ncbi:hypothetical protein NXX48_24400 [Bacteroides faecis]|uniref:hypothetical protein n=1 Tax=Bacteroides faecis TaxID=674529 RepID=UPI0021655C18|nr:hypothetical protein [Bacteroides faecis]MCS2977952.1 hypothetical protein [Bacteroides faecis]